MPSLSNRWPYPFFDLFYCDSILSCSASFCGTFSSSYCFGINAPQSSALKPLFSLYYLLKPSGHTISWLQSHLDAYRTQISIFSLGISSQSPKSIFPTAYWISPPECTARNSDSTFTKSNSLTTSGLQLNSHSSCCDGYDLTPVAQARNLGIILDLSIFFTPTSHHTLNAFNSTC